MAGQTDPAPSAPGLTFDATIRCDLAGYIAKFEENVMLTGIVVHVKGKIIG